MWETDQNFLPCVLDPSPACRVYFQLPLWEGSDSCWFGVKLLYTLKGLISVETDLSCARGETIGFYICIYYTVTRGSGVCFASTPRENSCPLLGRLLVSVGCSWAIGVRASLFLSCFSFSPETRMICLTYRLLWRGIDWLANRANNHQYIDWLATGAQQGFENYSRKQAPLRDSLVCSSACGPASTPTSMLRVYVFSLECFGHET